MRNNLAKSHTEWFYDYEKFMSDGWAFKIKMKIYSDLKWPPQGSSSSNLGTQMRTLAQPEILVTLTMDEGKLTTDRIFWLLSL